MGKNCCHVIVKVFDENNKEHFEWVNIQEETIHNSTLYDIEEIAKNSVNGESKIVIGVMEISEQELYTCDFLPADKIHRKS